MLNTNDLVLHFSMPRKQKFEFGEDVIFKIQHFYESRNFVFSSELAQNMGKRGSKFNNMYTSSMKKLNQAVRINTTDDEILITYFIDTVAQTITALEKQYWALEFELLKCNLLGIDVNERNLFKEYNMRLIAMYIKFFMVFPALIVGAIFIIFKLIG